MRRSLVPIVILALAIVAPCVHAGEADPAETEALVQGNTAFACDLYGRLRAEPGNLFVSPYSVSAALAMTREGAAGETRTQMDAVLHLPDHGAAEAFRALAAALEPPQVTEGWGDDRKEVPAYALSIANRLWGQVGFAFLDPFLDRLKTAFGAGLERVDFRQTEKARKIVNDWVARETQDRIQNIVPEGMPPADTRLMLANAIYFKASWQDPFSERATEPRPFHTEGGDDVEVPMMRRTAFYGYGEADGLQVLRMPYRSGQTSMIVVLPRERDGLAAVEAALSPERIALWLKSLKSRRVAVSFPRFEFTAAYELSKALQALGMNDAFAALKADFTRMTTEEPLYIGLVLHKAFVKVDEKGTEAAAATVVGMRAGAAMPQGEPYEFTADRPFLFLLRHEPTGSVLFLGRVTDPSRS